MLQRASVPPSIRSRELSPRNPQPRTVTRRQVPPHGQVPHAKLQIRPSWRPHIQTVERSFLSKRWNVGKENWAPELRSRGRGILHTSQVQNPCSVPNGRRINIYQNTLEQKLVIGLFNTYLKKTESKYIKETIHKKLNPNTFHP